MRGAYRKKTSLDHSCPCFWGRCLFSIPYLQFTWSRSFIYTMLTTHIQTARKLCFPFHTNFPIQVKLVKVDEWLTKEEGICLQQLSIFSTLQVPAKWHDRFWLKRSPELLVSAMLPGSIYLRLLNYDFSYMLMKSWW